MCLLSRLAIAIAFGITAVTSSFSTAKAVPVDLELSLLVDTSRSINAAEFATQIDGYEQAFRDSAVQSAIENLAPFGGIAVNMFFFGTIALEQIGWTQIDSAADAEAFAEAISVLAQPTEMEIGAGTNLANALSVATASIQSNAFTSDRLAIDISGDGGQTGNFGGSTGCGGIETSPLPECYTLVEAQRDLVAAAGIAINSLVIGEGAFFSEEELLQYFEDHVITPDGFVILTPSFSDFPGQVRNKIFREITGQPLPEPATWVLFGVGLAGLGFSRRKRRVRLPDAQPR